MGSLCGSGWQNTASLPVFPASLTARKPISYDTGLYKSHNLVERLSGQPEDWRRIAARHDRCAHTFYGAICLTAAIMF